MSHQRSAFLAFTLCLLASAVAHAAQEPAAVPARILDRVEETQLITLRGNVDPSARAEFDKGAVASNLPMKSMLLLLHRGPQQQAALDRLMADQQNPSSKNYHAWLTPENLGQSYGPAPADGKIPAPPH